MKCSFGSISWNHVTCATYSSKGNSIVTSNETANLGVFVIVVFEVVPIDVLGCHVAPEAASETFDAEEVADNVGIPSIQQHPTRRDVLPKFIEEIFLYWFIYSNMQIV